MNSLGYEFRGSDSNLRSIGGIDGSAEKNQKIA
jgi:hypothetical protein